MTDQIASIRKARHDARSGLIAAIDDAGVNTATTTVMTVLAGASGYTPEQQSARLAEAADVIADLPARVRAAADALAVDPRLPEIVALLRTAAEFAISRDFDGWQAQKAAAGDGALPALDGQGFVAPDAQIGDVLAAMLAE